MTTGCSRLNKSTCATTSHCEWIKGKGCKKIEINKPPVVTIPKGEWVRIFPNEVLKKLVKRVHPELLLSKSFYEFSHSFIFYMTKYLIRGAKKSLDIDDVVQRLESKNIKNIYPTLHEYASSVAKKKHTCTLSSKLTPSVFKKLFDKELTESAALYVSGILEEIFFQISEMSGDMSRRLYKRTITYEHVKQALKDDELNILIDKLYAH